MADILGKFYQAKKVRTGTSPSSAGVIAGEPVTPVNPQGSNPSHSPVTIGTANGLSLSGQELSLGLASSGVTGALSGADWDTFNGKIGGAGTVNILAKFTGAGVVGDSRLIDDGINAYFINQQNSFALGNGAGQVADYSNNIFALGYNAGGSNTTGLRWYASGYQAGFLNTAGSNWYASGYAAARSNTTGSNWYASGYSAGYSNTIGVGWYASGYQTGYSNTTGAYWYSSGYQAGFLNTAGSNWYASGYQAARSNTTGSNWYASGFQAARYYSAGGDAESFSNGLYIGYDTRVGEAGAINELVIGYQAKGEGSNKTVIGNSSTILTRLYGELRVNTINNLGTSATEVLVPDATGVVMKRTLAELASDGLGSKWTEGVGFIYRDDAVVVGDTNRPSNATFAVKSKTSISSHNFINILNSSGSSLFTVKESSQIDVVGNIFRIGSPTTNAVDVTFKSRYSGSGQHWFRLINSSNVVIFEATGTRINIPVQVSFGSLAANVTTSFSTQYAGSGNHILDMSSGFGANVFRFTATGNLIHTGVNLRVGSPPSPITSGAHFKSAYGSGFGSTTPAFKIDNGDDAECFLVRSDRQIIMAGLPTADPLLTGSLWNDSGTLKISAG